MKENFTRKTVQIKCQRCKGTGDIPMTKQVIAKLGLIDILGDCPNCNGDGYNEKVILLQDKTLTVQIKK